MKKILPIFTVGTCLLNASLNAQESDLDFLENDFKVGYEAEINTNATSSSRGRGSINFGESYISLNASYKNKIKVVLTGKLETLFENNNISFNDDFSIAEFIEEAFIEIREVGGTPTAIIVGKQPIPFGQNVQAMPLFQNNPLADLQEIKEVYGLTVDFTEGLFNIFDQVEIAAFETEKGNLSIGTINGMSLRLSKMLTDNLLLTIGHAELGNDHLSTGHESKTSVGLVGESKDGMLVGWVEGILFSNNPSYPNSKFAITAGSMVRVHRTTDVIVELNYVAKNVQQYAIGTRTALTSNLSMGLELRFNDYKDGRKDEVVLGVNATYVFGSSGFRPNDEYLFDDDKN